jgi:hypothetical protein
VCNHCAAWPCADGSRYQDGPRRHLDARAGVRHSPPLIGDDFKACPLLNWNMCGRTAVGGDCRQTFITGILCELLHT